MSAPRLRLDRSRYHSTVHGDREPHEKNLHFWQDGFPFDAGGKVIEDLLSDEQKADAERRASKQPKTDEASDGAPDTVGESYDDGEVNLELWLKGERRYLFDLVRTRIRDIHKRDCGSIQAAIDFLVDDLKVIPPKLVSKKLTPQPAAEPPVPSTPPTKQSATIDKIRDARARV